MKGRASHSDFIGIPRAVADSPAFKLLPPIARALYLDLRRQHNGYNNGQIAAVDKGAPWAPGLSHYGWAHSSIHKCLKLLLTHGLIEVTRQGGIGSWSRICTLYAFTDCAVIYNREKGVSGSQPTLSYRNFEGSARPKRKRRQIEGPPRGPIGASRGLVKVHAVNRGSS